MDKGDIAKGIKNARIKRNMSATEVCKLANIPKSSLSEWESGKTQPSAKSFMKLCKVFNMSALELVYGNSENEEKSIEVSNNQDVLLEKIKVPILGSIACGEPIHCNGDFEGFAFVPSNVKPDFALYAKGDSMIDARIYDGDIVLIKAQPSVENGEIAAVEINGEEATLKRVYWDQAKKTLTLMPANKNYAPMFFSGEELSNIKIRGKAIIFQSLIR